MGFEDVQTVKRTADKKPPTISYRGVKSKKTGQRSRSLNLIIGIPAWKARGVVKDVQDRKFCLQIDRGRRRVRIAICDDNKEGAVSPSALRSGAVTFRFGFVPMLGSDSAAQEDVMFMSSVPDVGWEFEAPSWFKEDERPEKPRAVA